MLTVTETEWSLWLTQYMLPFFRVLGLFSAAPLLSNRAIPVRVRIAAAIAITLAITPPLTKLSQPIPLGSMAIIPAIATELLIGIILGFIMRLILAAIDLAATFIGFQMGLSFALFFSPSSGAQTPVLNEFLGVFATLLFLALDGHLMLILALGKSLEWIPTAAPLSLNWSEGFGKLIALPVSMLIIALIISLPVTAAVLLTNIALGILTRSAPQLNLFAIGFPITITIGFLVLLLSFTALGEAMRSAFAEGLDAAEAILIALGALGAQ